MITPETDEADLLRRATAGDQQALAALFARYSDRLRKMVRLRLDRRMAGRIDASDVLQDASRGCGSRRRFFLRITPIRGTVVLAGSAFPA